MHPLRLAALLSLPLAVAAAIVVLALPRRMNHLTEAWAHRSCEGRTSTTAGLVAADLDFDDPVHAQASLEAMAAQGDVLGAVLRRRDRTEFARWAVPAAPSVSAIEVTVAVDSPGAAGGFLTVRFSTAELDAQTARNRRLAWTIAIGVLLLGAVASVGLTIQLRRATRLEVQREVEAGFDLLVEDLPDGILIHRAGTVSYVNARGRAMLAIAGSPRGLTVASLASPALDQLEDRPGVVALRTAATSVQVEVARKPIQFAGAPSELIVIRDVSERERLRTRLDVTQRLASVGSLAAGVAHEINNPLTVILASLEMLSHEVAAASEASELVDEATDATERVRRIVDDMRRLARGDDDSRPAPFAVGPAIQRAVALTAADVRQRALVEIDEGGTDRMVLGSESRFVQVVVNILVNAAHAMPTDAAASRHTIRIAAGERGERIEVTVTDDGVGIAPEILERVFDPFFTTKDVGVGTGLGLSICHSLMQAMSGSITLTSTVGVGTTVALQLPSAPATVVVEDRAGARPRATGATATPARPSATVRPDAAPIAGPSGPPRILVIDDEPGIRTLVTRMLGDHEVAAAESGPGALAMIARGERFDLILCDVLMPEMPGPAVRAALTRAAPDQARRMVFVTGGVDHRVEVLGDVAAVLRKPFSQAELAGFVAANLARFAACPA